MPPGDGGLQWWRSWPADPPAGRARIEDGLPRLVTNGPDYSTVTVHQEWPTAEPGFGMLEWDVALAAPDRAVFAAAALEHPGRVLVADYPIYPVGGPPAGTCRDVGGRPLGADATLAALFSTGCIYFPQPVLAHWWQERDLTDPFTDRTFALWHHAHYGPVRVCRDVHPQHLHGD